MSSLARPSVLVLPSIHPRINCVCKQAQTYLLVKDISVSVLLLMTIPFVSGIIRVSSSVISFSPSCHPD